MDIKPLSLENIPFIVDGFAAVGWYKPAEIFYQYLDEQNAGLRKIWVALEGNNCLGYVTLKWVSDYQPFAKNNTPEICDLNVLPQYRNKGLGSTLLDLAETATLKEKKRVGIGVGLYADYGAAQKLYIKRGYVPDGNGITYQCKNVAPGSQVCVDDDLVLWFSKKNVSYNKDKYDHTQIKLVKASIEQYPVIQNMGRFYVYEMSEYLGQEKGWEIPEDGLYECIDFKKYWQVKNAFPFLIYYENEIAGFVIIDKKGSEPQIDFNMAQFFILRKFKGHGFGRYVAQKCFDTFKGHWEVMVIPENSGAYYFWKNIIAQYTEHRFSEYTRTIAHLGHSVKCIFGFNSR